MAETLSPSDLLTLGRVEYFAQRRQWEAAAVELGRVEKASQASPAVKQYAQTVHTRLYESQQPPPAVRPTRPAAPPGKPPARVPHTTIQSRVTHRHMDADTHSDQIFDERGWEYNNMFLTEDDYHGWRHVVRGSVDYYQDGKNDLRPRQFSYQARKEGVRVTAGDIRQYLTHHAKMDPANPLSSYTSYTLPPTQLRGMDLQLTSERHEFHVMAGLAPYFRSAGDEYIYPRQIYGVRESYKFASWYRAAVGASYIRDYDERTEHIDPALHPRETAILAFEQDITVIPEHWMINTEHAYSDTDDNLRPDGRFGQNTKLKDYAHSVFSEWRWPAVRVLGWYERVEPQFRAPSDIGATGNVNNQTVASDREQLALRIYPRPVGPLYGNLMYSRTQNNLDSASDVETTREHWITAVGGLQLPEPWPQPSGRATFTRIISVPGSQFSPAARWVYDLSGELRKRWWETDWTTGYHYLEHDNDERTGFDNEYRRTGHVEASRGLWPGGFVTTRGAWTRAQDLFNNTTMRRHTEQEVGITVGSRLWSTASLSAGYTYQDLGAPTIVDSKLQTAGGGIVHTVSSTLIWPWTKQFRHGRKLQLIPSLHFHYADASDDLERHPDIGARFTARYAVRNDWRLEFMLEHRQDDDAEIQQVRSQEWRGWLVFTSKFGADLSRESPFR